jgi:hypothetical protein
MYDSWQGMRMARAACSMPHVSPMLSSSPGPAALKTTSANGASERQPGAGMPRMPLSWEAWK